MTKKYTFREVADASTKYFNDQMAGEVFVNKYALRDNEGNFLELTPDDMHHRLAKEFARIDRKFKKGPMGSLTEQDIYELFKDFKYIVPQGSPMAAIGNKFKLMSASNCTVVASPEDNLSHIMHVGNEMAQLLKRRCGVGIDLGLLRPFNTPVNNAAQYSSGAVSFADYYSFISRMIGQKGRQGAAMLTLPIEHPDVPMFAVIKHDPTKVTGANISLRITDSFMKAVKNKKDFNLRWPLEGVAKTKRTIDANKLFEVIVESAHKTGDPGLLMWDNITKNLPAHCYKEFETVCTNPCSEIALSAYDSCRLISINLTSYVIDPFGKAPYFNFDLFQEHVVIAQRLSDNLVELELELILQIRNQCANRAEKSLWHKMYEAARLGRRTGLGTHGLGDCLARLKLRYDSKEAQETVRDVFRGLRDTAYRASIVLAKDRGAFPVFNFDKEKTCDFIKRLPRSILADMKKYGRRNIALLTNAPTGTVALMSKTTSGIEPIFRLKYMRRIKIHETPELTVDFIDETGEKWHHYEVFHPAFAEYCNLVNKKLDPLKDGVPDFFSTSEKLDYQKNVELIGLIQSYIDHGVSCTINMPKDSTLEMVKDVYMKAWESGMKGVTVYVEGSKSGVLVVNEEGKEIRYTRAPKRPLDIPCDIHMTTCMGRRWLVIVGLMEGKPYEVFAGKAADLPMSRDIERAIIRKLGTHEYCLVYQEEGEEVFVPIKESFLEDNGMLVRLLINQSLRHGVPPAVLYDTVTKSSDINDFSRTVVRVLKRYITEESDYRLKCSNCGSKNMKPVDGCFTCNDCGNSRCN